LYDAGVPVLVPTGGNVRHNALDWNVSFMLIALLLLALNGGYLRHLWPTTWPLLVGGGLAMPVAGAALLLLIGVILWLLAH